MRRCSSSITRLRELCASRKTASSSRLTCGSDTFDAIAPMLTRSTRCSITLHAVSYTSIVVVGMGCPSILRWWKRETIIESIRGLDVRRNFGPSGSFGEASRGMFDLIQLLSLSAASLLLPSRYDSMILPCSSSDSGHKCIL